MLLLDSEGSTKKYMAFQKCIKTSSLTIVLNCVSKASNVYTIGTMLSQLEIALKVEHIDKSLKVVCNGKTPMHIIV